MKKTSASPSFMKHLVLKTLAAVGVKEADVLFSSNRIEIPSAGVTVSGLLEDGARVWKAEVTYSMMRMEDAFERSITNVLFSVPFGDEIVLARRLAGHVAASRIDAAVDAAVSMAASGRLQA